MAQLMTLEEVAGYLRVHKMTIYRWVQKGLIPAVKVGRQWRFDRDIVDMWAMEEDKEMWQRDYRKLISKMRKEASKKSIGKQEILKALKQVRAEQRAKRSA